MASKKDWVNKFDDNTLDTFFNPENILDEMPESLKNKLSRIPERYKYEQELKAKKSQLLSKKMVLRYSFAFAMIFIIIITGIYFSYNKIFKPMLRNTCIVSQVAGNIFLIDKNKKELISNGVKINESSEIQTEKESSVILKIGEKADISIQELSKLKIQKLYKNNNKETTQLFLEDGVVSVNISEINKDYSLTLITDILTAKATGTEFIVENRKNQYTKVKVYDGLVEIRLNINIKKIKKIDPEIFNRINKLLTQEYRLKKGEDIHVLYNRVKEFENSINEFINQLIEDYSIFKKDKEKIKNNFNRYNQVIDELFEEKDKFFSNKIEQNDLKEDLKEEDKLIKKLQFNPGIKLNEKYTAISGGKNKILISSESNRVLLCLDIGTGKLLWKFTDELITDITSPAIFFNNNIYLTTPACIFILNQEGKLLSKNQISDGTVYWAYPIKLNNSLYIPANDQIYKSSDLSISKIENLYNNKGQLYLGSDNKNTLFMMNINTNTLKDYNIEKNNSTWISKPIKSRAFLSPVYKDGFIFIADSTSSIYKYDYKLKNPEPKEIKIGTGVVSNLLPVNKNLYFVANDGYFYSINLNSFNKVNKISKVDNNPNKNKYLTKKLFLFDTNIYFSSDTGKIFVYKIFDNKSELIQIEENQKNFPLIGTPVLIDNFLYFVDTNSNIYRLKL